MDRTVSGAHEPFVIIEDLVDIGFDEGMAKGLVEGRAEGRVLMAREVIFLVLSMRNLPVSEAERARIESESSIETLKTWLRRGATCTSVAEVVAWT